MNVISQDDFIEKCKQGRCLRQTLKSKQCEKEYKQKQCYNKYVDKKTKEWERDHTEKDYRWEELKEALKLRDISCLFTKIATFEELRILEQNENWWLSRFIDGAHLIPRSMASRIIYDIDNVILLNRHSHTRLDNFLDLVTGEFIGLEGKKRWIERIMHENKLWDLNYSYEDFYKDKMNTNKNLG
jgi:hypothetical protein